MKINTNKHVGLLSALVLALVANISGCAAQTVAKSTTDTMPDGIVKMSGNSLALTPDLIARFEYHLSTMGDLTIAQVKANLVSQLSKEVAPAGVTTAARLFDAYIGFKTEMAKQPSSSNTSAKASDLEAQLKNARTIRLKFFSATEVSSMFNWDDMHDDYMLNRIKIAQTPGITDSEKQTRFDKLVKSLPSAMRDQIISPTAHVELADRIAAARSAGAGSIQIFAMRTSAAGFAAATRMASLDQEEAKWKARLDQYLAASSADRMKLKQTLFTTQEQLRLPAYEK